MRCFALLSKITALSLCALLKAYFSIYNLIIFYEFLILSSDLEEFSFIISRLHWSWTYRCLKLNHMWLRWWPWLVATTSAATIYMMMMMCLPLAATIRPLTSVHLCLKPLLWNNGHSIRNVHIVIQLTRIIYKKNSWYLRCGRMYCTLRFDVYL